MYGVLAISFGSAMYGVGVMFVLPRHLLRNGAWLTAVNEWIVWYSGVPLMTGLLLCAVDLLVLLGRRRVLALLRGCLASMPGVDCCRVADDGRSLRCPNRRMGACPSPAAGSVPSR
jgi:hypothetical protein